MFQSPFDPRHKPPTTKTTIYQAVDAVDDKNGSRIDKVTIKRKKEEFRPWLNRITNESIEKLRDLFVESIPIDSIRAMPPHFFYPIAIFIWIILIGLFLALFLPGYYQLRSQKTLSPVGSTDSDLCESVSVSNTGKFLATREGYWEGSKEFSYSNATYVVDGTDVRLTDDEYRMVMTELREKLGDFGAQSVNYDLGQNLMQWMAGIARKPSGLNISQTYYMTGSPLNVFRREKTTASLSSVIGDCVGNKASFDSINGRLSVEYDYNSFITDPICNSTINPIDLGYNDLADGSTFTISLDARAVTIGVAVNSGLLTLADLQRIEYSEGKIVTNSGEVLRAYKYYDARYPGMDAINCIAEPEFIGCFIRLGNIYGIPFFNHAGSSDDEPLRCDCETFRQSSGFNNKRDPCHRFKFISGVAFYNNPTKPGDFIDILKNVSVTTSHRIMFKPSYLGSLFGLKSKYRSNFTDISTRKEYFAPTYNTVNKDYVRLVTFTSLDITNINWAVSSYQYQLTLGACRDSFSTTLNSWGMLTDTPYAPLTEKYEICGNSVTDAFLNQLGVTAGNLQILVPITFMTVALLVYLLQVCTGYYIPRTYTISERKDAAEALALAMLLERDHKLQLIAEQHAGNSNNNSSMEMFQEVVALTKELTVLGSIYEEKYDYGEEVIYKLQNVNSNGSIDSDNDDLVDDSLVIATGTGSGVDDVDEVEMTTLISPGDSTQQQRQRMIAKHKTSRYKQIYRTKMMRNPLEIILNQHHNVDNKMQSIIYIDLIEYNLQDIQQVCKEYEDRMDVMIHHFRQILQSHNKGTDSLIDVTSGSPIDYWQLVEQTQDFHQFPVTIHRELWYELLTHDNTNEWWSVYILPVCKKLLTLMALHGSLYMGCDISKVYFMYGDKLAYYISDDKFTMRYLVEMIQEQPSSHHSSQNFELYKNVEASSEKVGNDDDGKDGGDTDVKVVMNEKTPSFQSPMSSAQVNISFSTQDEEDHV